MDPQTDLPDLIEDLEANIDDLSTSLTSLLPPSTLAKTASTLPLLEKAKLHTLTAYAIESLLFSALLTSGADAKAHPIYPELARLKGYFAKIKHAEEWTARESEREARARVDVQAVGRFIKHGLSGNERYDEMRREREKQVKERALEKARALTNKKFEEDGEGEGGTLGKRARAQGAAEDEDADEDADEGGDADAASEGAEDKHADGEQGETPASARKRARTGRQSADLEGEELAAAPKKRGRPAKKDKHPAADKDTPTRATRSSAPKTRSEAFAALASGSPASGAKAKGKGKGKGKGRAK